MDVSKSAFLQEHSPLAMVQASRGPLASRFNYRKTFGGCPMVFLGFPRSCAIILSPPKPSVYPSPRIIGKKIMFMLFQLEKVLIIQGSVQWDLEIHYF